MFVLSNSILTKIRFVNLFYGSAWRLIFAGASNLSYLFHFSLGALIIFRVLQKLSIVIGTDIYYIDTDEFSSDENFVSSKDTIFIFHM